MFTASLASALRPLLGTAPARPVGLRLEALEDRNLPSVAANDVFVSTLYQGLLGRNADPGALAYWDGQLESGSSRAQVAKGIAGSDEALGRDVNIFYNVLLQRPADADGLAYWTEQLKEGATLDQVKAGILGSDEFFSKSGGTAEGFLNSLYHDELGRPVDAAGLNYWEGQLNAGTSDAEVAARVLASPEAANVKTASFYEDVLGRAPDAGGLAYWSGQLQAGVSETNVLSGLLGSAEYFARVQSVAVQPTSTDPNAAATKLIDTANLFTGPLPNAEYLAHRLTVLPPTQGPQGMQEPVAPDVTPDGGTGDVSGFNITPVLDTSSTIPCDTTTPTCVDTTPTTCDDSSVIDNTVCVDTSTDVGDCAPTVDDSGNANDSAPPDYSYTDTGATDSGTADPGTDPTDVFDTGDSGGF
jgi:hypothetical protein